MAATVEGRSFELLSVSPQRFELRCAEVHPVRCDVTWASANPMELVSAARDHGAAAHGFTPAWYTAARVAAMSGAVSAR